MYNDYTSPFAVGHDYGLNTSISISASLASNSKGMSKQMNIALSAEYHDFLSSGSLEDPINEHDLKDVYATDTKYEGGLEITYKERLLQCCPIAATI